MTKEPNSQFERGSHKILGIQLIRDERAFEALEPEWDRLLESSAQRVYFQLMDLQDVSHVEYLGEVLPHLPR